MTRWGRQGRWARWAVIAGVVAICACQSGRWAGFPEPAKEGPVWPEPPEVARVAWVMEIGSHTDLFREAGLWTGLKRWVGGAVDSQISRPYALAMHPEGGLLVTDPGRARVHGYFWERRDYVAYGTEREGGLPSPVGVAALDDGRVVVSDSRLNRLLVYTRDGKALGEFAQGVEFGRPAGLAFDARRGRLWVADVLRHQIAELTGEGELVRWIGGRGAGPGEFNFPTDVAVAAEGGIAVTDSMNFRIQLLDVEGAAQGSAGRLGNAPGTFAKPKGVTVARGVVIGVEGLHDSVQFFDARGALLLSIGRSGQGAGEFWLPAGLCYDGRTGLLFVADGYNHRVQVFRMLEEARP